MVPYANTVDLLGASKRILGRTGSAPGPGPEHAIASWSLFKQLR